MKFKWFFLGTIFFIMTLANSSYSQHNSLKVHFIDVGYGDAILLEIDNKEVILIDSGPADYSEKVRTFRMNHN